MPAFPDEYERFDRLHRAFEAVLHEHGTMTCEELVRRTRAATGDLTLRRTELLETADRYCALVVRPEGNVSHVADVLGGVVLTHRARGRTRGRRDLWIGNLIQPITMLAQLRVLPLAGGGVVEVSHTDDNVLIGPAGWLPDVPRDGLVALRWADRTLSVSAIDTAALASPAEHEHVRSIVASLVDRDEWFDSDDLGRRNRLVEQAVVRARLVDPDLLSTPHLPLDELLYDPLEQQPGDLWRDAAAYRQVESVSFVVDALPVHLERELRARARHYGMTENQFIVAMLGHIAWRTPFAEDVAPWEAWLPESAQHALRVVSDPDP